MKKQLLLLLLIFSAMFLPARIRYFADPLLPDSSAGSACIDSSKICTSCVCPLYVYPVCGCNGITYINSCYAINAGVLFWTTGACGIPGCLANFTDSAGTNGLGLDFTSISSGNYNMLNWNFGDGDSINAGDTTVHHIYAAPGLYTVCLTVSIGDTSCLNTYCQTVAVAPPGPCPDTSLIQSGFGCGTDQNPVCGCNGVTYNNACEAFYHYGVTTFTSGQCPSTSHCQPAFNYFTDSSGYTVYFQYDQISNGLDQPFTLSIQWNFGDGQTDTGQYPIHTYTDTSIHAYWVCVTATDTSQPCTSTFCDSVHVGGQGLACKAAFNYSIAPNGVVTVYPDSAADGAATGGGWIIGGDTTNAGSPSIQLDSGSNYNICYYVTNDSLRCSDTVCMNVQQIYAAFLAMGNQDISNAIHQAYVYPNPAVNTAGLRFNVAADGLVDILVRNMLGEVVYQLPQQQASGNLNGGSYTYTLNLSDLSSGVYLVELRLNNSNATVLKLVKM